MPTRDPERGDIIVYEKRKTFPTTRTQEFTTVVEEVDADAVYCGIDGRILRDRIVSIEGKSPDYNPESDEFNVTVVE